MSHDEGIRYYRCVEDGSLWCSRDFGGISRTAHRAIGNEIRTAQSWVENAQSSLEARHNDGSGKIGRISISDRVAELEMAIRGHRDILSRLSVKLGEIENALGALRGAHNGTINRVSAPEEQ